MPLYLLRVSQNHPTFRIPSLQAIADVYQFDIKFVTEDKTRSILVVEVEAEQVDRLLERGTLILCVGVSSMCSSRRGVA
jgi:tRNA (guanine10-N2)-methyltransferase